MSQAKTPRNPLLTKAYRVIDVVIDGIEHLPEGHRLLHGVLPRKGRQSLPVARKSWAYAALKEMVPTSFLDMVLFSVILPSGIPNQTTEKLYTWLLVNRYNNDSQAMYADWLSKRKGM